MLVTVPWCAMAQSLTGLSDEFDDPGSLAAWSRVVATEGWGNDVLEVFDVDTTRPGHLVMVPYSSSWFAEWRGELTYKTVTGDFVITTHVEPRNRAGTGRPERDYSLAGIMVRTPRAMTVPAQWTPNGQNYVFLSMGAANRTTALFQFEVKTTINSVSILDVTDTSATRAAIQVARIGPHIITLRREEGGVWTVHRRYFRNDFPETMQAGLTVYTDWNTCFSAGYVNNNLLVLTNGAVLLNSSVLSGAVPDLVASFDYVRYARPQVPAELAGANFSDPASVSDAQLLAFLGEAATIPGGAAEAPFFVSDNLAGVVSQRSYRVQVAAEVGGPWTDLAGWVSTASVVEVETIPEATNDVRFFRLVTP
jgi:hypothetical protein